MSVTLRRTVPLNIPANGVHSENDTVDFILTHEGESLELGSIRLEGELQIRNNDERLTKAANDDKDIVIDRWIGAHCIVENIQRNLCIFLVYLDPYVKINYVHVVYRAICMYVVTDYIDVVSDLSLKSRLEHSNRL